MPRTVRAVGHDQRVSLAPSPPCLAALRAGTRVEGIFACTRKDRLTARTGAPYLAVELRDRTAAVEARAFRDPDFLSARFERGDLVSVTGRVERFRDALHVELESIARAPAGAADPADFLPVAYRDLDELDGFLEHLAGEVSDPRLAPLLHAFLSDDSLRAALRRAPCSRAGHHAYLGGLLEHTVGVATLAHDLCALHPRLDSGLLLTAALLHDVGKVREYRLGAEISLSEEGRMLGHLALGALMVSERLRRVGGVPPARALALLHCIQGHHGPDALPGRRFASPEALALFRLNAVDAGVKAAFERGL
jgi:3'-5' exoribonuclease